MSDINFKFLWFGGIEIQEIGGFDVHQINELDFLKNLKITVATFFDLKQSLSKYKKIFNDQGKLIMKKIVHNDPPPPALYIRPKIGNIYKFWSFFVIKI